MTGDFMDAARDHLVVLLNEQKEILQALSKEEGLLHSRTEDGKERVLSREDAAQYIENLEEEADKASRLEITLAVAGTVNAGKSTAVNAIIGTEALPNRSSPMTALPTVIRHEPGRFEPGLKISNYAALNGLAKRIARKLRRKKGLAAVRSSHGADMEALIDDLTKGGRSIFYKEYEGRDRVFEALGRINDLLRLGRHKEVEEELAIEKYDNVHEMPALTVHFRCLADIAQQSGSLALVDLPGFNEAQQSEHLTDVFNEQLGKASALLVVLDYDQRNTVASKQLEMFLDRVSGIMRGRTFVVVNKFDQRTSRDPDATTLKDHISANMMRDQVDPGHIYPVSAKHAYLARRALDALARNRGLPSADDEPWVADFGDLVFRFNDAKLEDPEEVNRAARQLWFHSGFDPLLNDVVIGAQRRAGEFVLQSALARLKQYGGEIENYLNISANSLTMKIQDLEDIIRSTNETVQAVEKAKGDFDARIESTMYDINTGIRKILDTANEAVGKNIEIMFDREMEDIIKDRQGVRRKERPFSKKKDLKDWTNLTKKLKEEGKLEYKDKNECGEAWEKVREIYSNVAAWIVSNASSSIEDLMNQTCMDLERVFDNGLHEILEAAQLALGDGGIEVNLRVPEFDLGEDSGGISASPLARNIRTGLSEPRTVVTHRLANFLDPFDLFGWGKKEKRDRVYVIDRGKVIGALGKGLADTLGSYSRCAEVRIKEWRRHADDKFAGIGKYLDRYCQSLIDGLSDRSMETERREKILAAVNGMKNKCDDSRANLGDFETAMGYEVSAQ